MKMNWKLLSATAMLVFFVGCEGKKEEKAHEATPPEAAAKVEEHKAGDAKPAETPKEEHKKEEHKTS